MIITHLEGTNWGRHHTIDFDCNAGIVGVVGKNGAGKSSILDLVEFLITGQTRDNLESYVRYGEGNASGRLTFIKNGRTGTIFRQIGSTKKRSLEWDGRTMTSAKEVDATMAEIFGADKKALANSVFVKQGTLEAVLFKEGVDRQRAFIQLVNLSFCAQRADMIGREIGNIRETVVDLGPARDEATRAKLDAQGSVENIQAELTGIIDYSAELEFLRKRTQTTTELNLVRKQLGDLAVQHQTAENELTNLLAGATPESVEEWKASLEQQHATASTAASTYQTIMVALTHYSRLTTNIDRLKGEIEQLEAEDLRLNPAEHGYTLEQMLDYATTIDGQIVAINKRNELNGKVEEFDTELKGLSQQMAAAIPPFAERHIEDKRTTHRIKSGLRDQMKRWQKLQDQIQLNLAQTADTCGKCADCPECGLRLNDVSQLSEDSFTKRAEELALIEGEVAELDVEIKADVQTLKEYNENVSVIRNRFNFVKQEIAKLNLQLSKIVVETTSTIEELDADRIAWRKLHTDIQQLRSDIKTKRTSLSLATSERNNYKTAEAHWDNRSAFTATQYKEMSDEVVRLNGELVAARDYATNVGLAKGRLDSAKASLEVATKSEEALLQAFDEQPPGALAQLFADDADLVAIEANMVAEHSRRLALEGAWTNACSSYQTALNRLNEIEARIGENAKKLELLKDLTRLRDLLNDDGIPMLFIKHKFEKLAQYTQEGLLAMNANFFVSISPEQPLSFEFVRLDEATKIALPMVKLSGGQRVRLCVAFLMALQKTLIKDVGLLVADEISCHVDSTGVEQMVEFLTGLRAELKNSEHQIWLVDHNPVMKGALEKCLQL